MTLGTFIEMIDTIDEICNGYKFGFTVNGKDISLYDLRSEYSMRRIVWGLHLTVQQVNIKDPYDIIYSTDGDMPKLEMVSGCYIDRIVFNLKL